MQLGIGYIVGCLFSILLWKFDRMVLLERIDRLLRKFIKQDVIIQFFYIVTGLIIVIWLKNVNRSEWYNLITAFIVIDVSNTERKNLNIKEKARFYDSISLISRSILCGFIAPLFFIITLGNSFALAYTLFYNLSYLYSYNIIKAIFNVLSIVPAFITQALLYIVYLIRNKRIHIDFKGDFLINCFIRPLLNIDILGAYIESVNFYYHFNDEDMHYLKSYGEYSNKIDEICIKDYLSIGYGICIICFIIFFFIIRVR